MPKSVPVTPAERSVIVEAMQVYLKSLERAVRAAPTKQVADAYEAAAGTVRALSARVEFGELEI